MKGSQLHYTCMLMKRRDKWVYPNEKGISSSMCDLRSKDVERNECSRTLHNSRLWKDLDMSPCVVSK